MVQSIEEKEPIVFDIDSRLEPIIKTLYLLHYQAEKEDMQNGYQSELRWELGARIVAELRGIESIYVQRPSVDTPMKAMGISVDINYEDIDMIKLWREVKG